MPVCRACTEEKPEEAFPLRNAKVGTRQTRCKPCLRAYARAWYERKRDERCEQVSEWKRKNPEKVKRYRERNRKRYREYDHVYRHKNPDVRRANNAAYRARKNKRTLKLSGEARNQIREVYRRASRLTRETGTPHHVDHLIPLNHPLVCGLHVPWNLQVIPGKLNLKKSNVITLDTLAYSPVVVSNAG